MADSKELAFGPGGSRRRLRYELRRAREAAVLTQEQVADAMHWHLSKVIRIESGTSGISPNDLRALLGLYGIADGETVETMIGWAIKARERTWWAAYRGAIPRPYAYYIGLESEAVAVRYFQAGLIPGLFQTEDYARGPAAASLWAVDEEFINQRVGIRLRRQQEAFSRPDPLQISAVIDEAVVRRAVGSPKVMKQQLEHLLALTTRPTVQVHVVPFTVTARPFTGDGFAILEFATQGDDTVYVEEVHASTMDRRDDVSTYRTIYNYMLGVALDAQESRGFIQAIVDSL
jgi:transcriptional regulator with XRE-family HTH domain